MGNARGRSTPRALAARKADFVRSAISFARYPQHHLLQRFFCLSKGGLLSLSSVARTETEEKHDAKKGPTDCRGRPLVEVSVHHSEEQAKARFLPGRLSIGPFQQSRFSTTKSAACGISQKPEVF